MSFFFFPPVVDLGDLVCTYKYIICAEQSIQYLDTYIDALHTHCRYISLLEVHQNKDVAPIPGEYANPMGL